MFWEPVDIVLVGLVIIVIFVIAAIMADSDKENWIDSLMRRKR